MHAYAVGKESDAQAAVMTDVWPLTGASKVGGQCGIMRYVRVGGVIQHVDNHDLVEVLIAMIAGWTEREH